MIVRPLFLRRACALALLGVALLAGRAHAQGGVWSVIPVPGTSVAGTAEGDSGQVLIAGANGAFRFDGFRMRRLPIFSATGDSLVGKAILKARNGDIWFAHLQGVVRLAPDGTVARYDASSGLGNHSDSEATSLAETPDGMIWVGTKLGGLSKFDGMSWSTLTTDQGLPSQSVAALAVDPRDGSIWAGCLLGTGGLAHVVGGTITKFVPTSSPVPNVRSVVVTNSGRVWFGTDSGIGRLENGTMAEFATGTGVPALAAGANGDLWIGTATRGLGRFDSGAATFFPSGPPSNSVLGLFADPAGVLWVGTSAGLARYEGAPWFPVNSATLGLPNLGVLSGMRDPAVGAPGDSVDAEGATWLGMTNVAVPNSLEQVNLVRRVNGVNRLLGTADGLPGGHVRAVAPADSGQVWVGTYSNPGSGLARIALDGRLLQKLDAELPAIDVLALERAGAGSVWVGTSRGVALVAGASVHALPTGAAAVPDAAIRGLDLDPRGRLWIATGTLPGETRPGQGAVLFDPADSSYVHYDVTSGLPTNTLNGVTATHDGDVWFATPLGAARLRSGGITTFTTAHGLPSNNVTRIGEGPEGRLWFATAGGLAEFDGLNWTVYTVGDGLAGGSLANVFADSLGIVACAQNDGASLFRPDRTPPRAEIQLAPPLASGNPDVQFGIRGGDLDSGTRGILLAYRLDDGTSTPFAEDVSTARFQNLPDGTHTFRLWAKDRALNETAVPEVWTFTVDATAPRPVVQKPAFDSIVRDTVDVIGTVADPRFAFYTVELRPVGRVAWDTLFVSSAPPASGDTLYRWDTTASPDGVWELRVGATDSLGLNGYVSVKVVVDNLEPNAGVTAPAKIDHVLGGRIFTTDGQVELSVPPNAYAADQIVFIDPLAQPALPSGMPPGASWGPSFVIHATDMTLDKPATLTFHLTGVAQGVPAAFYRVQVADGDTSLVPIGGGRAADGATISTTLSSLGGIVVLYGTGVAAGDGFAGARGLDCQPRVISPNGGGFDTRLSISFDVGTAGSGAVKVFDRAGRLVREVSENDAFSPGRNVVFWDGRDGSGNVVASGVYMVAVRFDGQTQVASVVVANR